jgi:release factor glutamine methyltransferase
VKSELVFAVRTLQEAGIETARLDAELLMARVTGMSRERMITHADTPMSAALVKEYRELVAKRGERYPLPYLIGVWEFWGLDFEVNPSVLIPRPETEILVEAVVEWLEDRPSVIGEIGAGSGAIAVAIASELPDVTVYATEISRKAARTAAANAARNEVADRVKILVGDLAQPLYEYDLKGRVTALVSNPPYILEAVEADLQPEVQMEPRLATIAGEDSLHFYRRILAEGTDLLTPGGRVFFEIDPGMSGPIAEMGAGYGLRFVEMRRDLAGLERVVILECESSK